MSHNSETGPPPPPGNGVAEELAMLEKVFFRIASANSDEELTEMIQKYLPPIILKLSSSREGVRKKIMEMLVHINKRIKSNDNILLPMDALLVQYQVCLDSFINTSGLFYNIAKKEKLYKQLT